MVKEVGGGDKDYFARARAAAEDAVILSDTPDLSDRDATASNDNAAGINTFSVSWETSPRGGGISVRIRDFDSEIRYLLEADGITGVSVKLDSYIPDLQALQRSGRSFDVARRAGREAPGGLLIHRIKYLVQGEKRLTGDLSEHDTVGVINRGGEKAGQFVIKVEGLEPSQTERVAELIALAAHRAPRGDRHTSSVVVGDAEGNQIKVTRSIAEQGQSIGTLRSFFHRAFGTPFSKVTLGTGHSDGAEAIIRPPNLLERQLGVTIRPFERRPLVA